MQENPDKETSTDKVQREKKGIKEILPEARMFLLCCRGISDVRTEDIKVHNG
jgi:hypothetical protein